MLIEEIFEMLKKNEICFFTGVPDSYLNGFCNYLKRNYSEQENVIAANEGNAIGIASGYYLSTGKIPLVYMQNSGMGNALNPLVSLADKHIYSMPMILLIGWRGQPGTKDGEREQHIMQGKLTEPLLKDMEIPYHILSSKTICKDIEWAVALSRDSSIPVALIVPDGVLTERKINAPDGEFPLGREEAISIVLDVMPKDTTYVASTGRATRELFCLRELRGQGHEHDFLNIGAMGHASSVAMGLAVGNPKKRIVCLDGDAATIMHMGALTMISKLDIPNYMHIVLNNGSHESVGGQPSAGFKIDLTHIAQACGYFTVGHAVTNEQQLKEALRLCIMSKKASFVDIHIHSGIRSDLKSINMSGQDLVLAFTEEIRKDGCNDE